MASALAAHFGHAGLAEFDAHWQSPEVQAWRERVTVVLDAEVDAAYPTRWIGKIEVRTTDGRGLEGRVDDPKGDPGNTLTRAELEAKALKLAVYRSGASDAEMRDMIARIWALDSAAPVGRWLTP